MLQALPYHKKVCDYFQAQQKTWDFFAAAQTRKEQLGEFKLELLKNTYKFDPATDKDLFDMVDTAREKLGLENLPVHLYQVQFTDEINATIVFLEGEAHIVFSGPIKKLLTPTEFLGVLAHELAHIKLFTMQEGAIEITDRIITAIANNYHSETAWLETARLFRLYTEIFCDRGSYEVLGETGPVISSLVKIATGLDNISPESYLKQADEIFAAEDGLSSAHVSHPENFIRARAIQLYKEQGAAADEAIVKMIEGHYDLDKLDLFRQKELSARTRQFLQLYLKPKWFQSTMVLSLARQYFPDFSIDPDAVLSTELTTFFTNASTGIKEYFSCLLLDFALADPALELVPFGWALQLAEDLHLKEPFSLLVKRELKLSEKKLQTHTRKALDAYYEVKESTAEQIYEP